MAMDFLICAVLYVAWGGDWNLFLCLSFQCVEAALALFGVLAACFFEVAEECGVRHDFE